MTYLGSLVEGLSDGFKDALVASAVTVGGLTIIANEPNPAGIAILRGHFDDEAVHPLGLLLAALPPTIIAALAFRFPLSTEHVLAQRLGLACFIFAF